MSYDKKVSKKQNLEHVLNKSLGDVYFISDVMSDGSIADNEYFIVEMKHKNYPKFGLVHHFYVDDKRHVYILQQNEEYTIVSSREDLVMIMLFASMAENEKLFALYEARGFIV